MMIAPKHPPSEWQHDPFVGFLMWAVMVAGFAFVGLRQRMQARATYRWRPVDAEIIEASIEDKEVQFQTVMRMRYRPILRYQYAVNGVTHQSSRPWFGFGTWWKFSAHAENEIGPYYNDRARLKAYVDPNNPAEAVLVRGKAATANQWMIKAAIIFAGGLVFIVLSLKF